MTETQWLNGGADANSRWSNLGLWRGARSYAEAAEALAACVFDAAGAGQGDRPVVLGVGFGEGLRVLGSRYGVASAVVFEPDPTRADAARAAAPWADVRVADAAALGELDRAAFTHVLAVDSAYHFGDKAAFVTAAADRLAPGGRLVVTDLVLGPRIGASLARPLLQPAGIDPCALLTPRRYRALLQAAGFVDIALTTLSPHVLVGFATWLREHVRAHPVPLATRRRAEITAAVGARLVRAGVLRVDLVEAALPATSAAR